MEQVFSYFSKKSTKVKSGKRDVTLQVHELLEMLKIANLLGSNHYDLGTDEVVEIIERYYAPDTTFKSKVTQEKFEKHLAANPQLLEEQIKQEGLTTRRSGVNEE
mmetsp:Transcript_12331/g.20729  ORF Transcript_12331/g.20729 Transcript_12331/m.20729 type:complete len:105 (+) Transcript_12331:701-1015(+)